MSDTLKFPLVYAVWDDSESFDAWRAVSEYKISDVVLIHSVGFLIMENETSIAIAPNLSADPADPTVCAIMRIPKSAIQEMHTMEFVPERKVRK
jgi:hypothetical protein